MKFIKIFASYRKLSPADRQFVRRPVLHETRSLGDWLKSFEALVAYDKLDPSKFTSSLLWNLFFWGNAGHFAYQYATCTNIVDAVVYTLFASFLSLFPAFLLFFVSLFVPKESFDIHDNLRDTVVPFLELLTLDLPLEAPVELRLNLNRASEEALLSSREYEQEANPPQVYYPKRVVEKRYGAECLGISFRLRDKTTVKLSLYEALRRRDMTRLAGKRKAKTKFKLKTRVQVQLSADERVYQLKGPLTSGKRTRYQHKQSGGKLHLKVTQDVITSRFYDLNEIKIPLKSLTAVIGKAYRQLQTTS